MTELEFVKRSQQTTHQSALDNVIDTRLATYGTLAPGQPNHHQLSALRGEWQIAHVHGWLVDDGWGAELGYPAMVLDPHGPPVPVHLFESPDLQEHWQRLDAFEGGGYRRVSATLTTLDGDVDAWIYVSAARADGDG